MGFRYCYRICGRRDHSAAYPASSQKGLARPWASHAPGDGSIGDGRRFLPLHYADFLDYVVVWQGRAVAVTTPRSFELLDSTRAAVVFGRSDETTILKSKASAGENMSILIELWNFMRMRKRYWLAPIVFMLLVFGGLIILSQGSAVAPFIYTLF